MGGVMTGMTTDERARLMRSVLESIAGGTNSSPATAAAVALDHLDYIERSAVADQEALQSVTAWLDSLDTDTEEQLRAHARQAHVTASGTLKPMIEDLSNGAGVPREFFIMLQPKGTPIGAGVLTRGERDRLRSNSHWLVKRYVLAPDA